MGPMMDHPHSLCPDVGSYLPVLILVTGAVIFGIMNVVMSIMIGPRRDGAVKSMTYESGMNPVGTARKRFNVRFYLIAMVFLVFDIEIIFLYPWATTFANIDQSSGRACHSWAASVLHATTVVAYVYRLRFSGSMNRGYRPGTGRGKAACVEGR